MAFDLKMDSHAIPFRFTLLKKCKVLILVIMSVIIEKANVEQGEIQ